MRVTVCGVRGSSPSPGPEFLRYGGNTSCVAIAGPDGVPHLVLDAGTGIRAVTPLLGGRPYQGAVLLGHLHWDHTQGLPFFRAGDDPGSRVDLFLPAQGDAEEVLGRAMSPPHFPILPGDLRGAWRFNALEPGEHEIEGFRVLALPIPHKGGRTYGYRVSGAGGTLAYLSDHCPTSLGPGTSGLGELHEDALALCRGADVVFHDAQYTDDELPARAYFGHSSDGYALELARAAGAGRLVLFHHDLARTDDEVDAIVARHRDDAIPVEAAREGMVLDLPD